MEKYPAWTLHSHLNFVCNSLNALEKIFWKKNRSYKNLDAKACLGIIVHNQHFYLKQHQNYTFSFPLKRGAYACVPVSVYLFLSKTSFSYQLIR